ncbi:MAG: DUF4445 domain-containing protein [Bacteroidetes bacterium]|nr:DUF4445 domain-containing protein [Bacteroidota bacterium]
MIRKATVKLEPLGIELKIISGTPLIDILHEYGVEFPCGGKGICGRCRVKVPEGNLAHTKNHRKKLTELGLSEDFHLACLSAVSGDVTLDVEQYKTFILADNTNFEFTPREGYGIAIDLGTTTIVVQLLDLSNGKVINVKTEVNPQARFGADIISRIAFALNNQGQEKLQKLIRKTISRLIHSIKKENDASVNKVVIVGNAVMQHLFCGIDPTPLSVYPFESVKKEFYFFSPEELDLQINAFAKIVFLPSIGSFVGSDILAGIMAAKIHQSEKFLALIDLGTNGEIVVGNKDNILCASTAAGPAFEGTNISMGMRATSGAISSMWLDKDQMKFHVIGNEQPRGICGSGLIDAVSVFLKNGLIDKSGKINENKKELMVGKPVFLTQKDIREFQLAKGAIATGIDILIRKLNINFKDIEKVFIAGAFGNYINISNTQYLGLLEFPEEKIVKLGNSALIGAKMALFLDDKCCEDILNISEHVSLETATDFQDVFIEKMMFG